MKSILTISALLLFAGIHAQSSPPPVDVTVGDSTNSRPGTVLVEARFPGGAPGWQRYLEKNLRAEVAAENIVLKRRQKDSAETVMITFLVDKEGNISETKVENPEAVNPAVGAEAVRVIQKGPKWLPAIQNGKPVIYRQKQSITFMVSKG